MPSQDAPLNALRNHGDYCQLMRDGHSTYVVSDAQRHTARGPSSNPRGGCWRLAAGGIARAVTPNPARVSAAAASSTGLAWTLAGRVRNHQVTTIKEGQLVAITNAPLVRLRVRGLIR